jgi:hypothetical protein
MTRFQLNPDGTASEVDEKGDLVRIHSQHQVEDLLNSLHSAKEVGDKPLSRVTGVLRDVMSDGVQQKVQSTIADSLDHVSIVCCSWSRMQSDLSDNEQYRRMLWLAAYAIRVAEEIKREGALK